MTKSQRFPVATSLPGVSKQNLNFVSSSRGIEYAVFRGKSGQIYKIFHQWNQDESFLVQVNNRLSAHFFAWPGPLHRDTPVYPRFFCALTIIVNPRRDGIASGMLLYAREVLAERNLFIAPSDNQTLDGVKLWQALDPSIKFREVPEIGGYQPDLSNRLYQPVG